MDELDDILDFLEAMEGGTKKKQVCNCACYESPCKRPVQYRCWLRNDSSRRKTFYVCERCITAYQEANRRQRDFYIEKLDDE